MFDEAGCGACHTLAVAGSHGTAGPDLDARRLTAEEVAAQVRAGGGGMPAYGDRLSDREIRAVARYVARGSASGS